MGKKQRFASAAQQELLQCVIGFGQAVRAFMDDLPEDDSPASDALFFCDPSSLITAWPVVGGREVDAMVRRIT